MSKEIVFAPAVSSAAPAVSSVASAVGGVAPAIGGAALAAGVLPIVLAGGAVFLAGMAAVEVGRLIGRDLEEARREGRRERAAFVARLQAQERVREQTADAQRAKAAERAAVRDVLDRLGELKFERPVKRSPGGTESRDFLAGDRRQSALYEQSLVVLAEVEQTLNGLSQELLENAQAPFGRLASMVRAHRERVVSGSSSIADTAVLQETAQRTITAWNQRQDQALAMRERLRSEARALLDEALECRELAPQGDDWNEVNQLVLNLAESIEQDRTQGAAVGTFRRRLIAVKERVTFRLHGVALRTWVAGQVGKQLADMGYAAIDPFTSSDANSPVTGAWRLPDGGRVSVALQTDGKLQAKLDGASSEGENRWCTDARKLLRRLVADGMPYELVFERRLPSMPVVTLHTADELFHDEEEGLRARAAELARQAGKRRG